MKLTARTFNSKDGQVKAWQMHGDPFNYWKQFADLGWDPRGRTDGFTHTMTVTIPKTGKTASLKQGDWIVTHSDGHVVTLTDEMFKQTYTEVTQ